MSAVLNEIADYYGEGGNMWNPYDFSGKKILLTGATSGIGESTAVKLSRQGATLFLIGRTESKLNDTMGKLDGGGHRGFVKELAEDGGYKEILDDIVSDGKKIDGFVHSAGVAKVLPVSMLKKKTMDESMTINYYSFAEISGILSKKKYHDTTSIVGVSSIAVDYPNKCLGAYAATKAAMNALTKALAIEMAEKNIRINTVMPSSTNTRMLKESFEGEQMGSLSSILEKQVLGLAEPEDVADVIMFLLSDASRMITGRSVCVDGGFLNFI